jgi:hypothetical protein
VSWLLTSMVVRGYVALVLAGVFAVKVGPWFRDRALRLEDDWKFETGARCNGRSVQTSTAVNSRAGRRA